MTIDVSSVNAHNCRVSAPAYEACEEGTSAALLTGGLDPHYACALAVALVAKGMHLEVVGSDDLYSPEMRATTNVVFHDLWFGQRKRNLVQRMSGLLTYYLRLLRYAYSAKPHIFHILWNGRAEYFDRTLLMLYYKSLGKKVALTVHNVNAGTRDSNDSILNRFTLKMQYRLADRLFVHTGKMKQELIDSFGVTDEAITVIPYGINNLVPDTELTPAAAKRRLGIRSDEKAILFVGTIRPYKGIETLLTAFRELVTLDPKYRLIIAGEPKKESRDYAAQIENVIQNDLKGTGVIRKMEFIPDDEMEIYLKAADVLVLPYKQIFQSGILFLAYSFGLPVIATDVGSLREDIVEGKTGFVCPPDDPAELAKAIRVYFESSIFSALDQHRSQIQEYARAHHSWDVVGDITQRAYRELLYS